ncbi:UNVERIFIED_CONTAM: hypothetical protein NCL1_30927 [Trichonephila clavipes]
MDQNSLLTVRHLSTASNHTSDVFDWSDSREEWWFARARETSDGTPFLFTSIKKSASEIKEVILDVRFPKQKNRRVIFQWEDRVRLTLEHVVLLTATLPQLMRLKTG